MVSFRTEAGDELVDERRKLMLLNALINSPRNSKLIRSVVRILFTRLNVSDSESEDAPGKDTNNPGCKRGIRGGSVKDGKVQFYIPPPPVPDPKFPPGRCRGRQLRNDLRRRSAGERGVKIF
jgi:hypothetical protein